MSFILEHIELERNLIIWKPQEDTSTLPLVLLPTGEDADDLLHKIAAIVQNAIAANQCNPFVLAAFSSDDWNSDFSPWPAPPLFAKEGAFAGNATQTLHWVQTALLPFLATHNSTAYLPQNTAIAGYSLAGLFALWAFYQGNLFNAAGGCSGSLWYDGWEEYTAQHTPPANSRIYLSLGDKEEKARNPRMARVGDATRHLHKQLLEDANVEETILHWNSGGHFSNEAERLAHCLIWLMRP